MIFPIPPKSTTTKSTTKLLPLLVFQLPILQAIRIVFPPRYHIPIHHREAPSHVS